MIKLFFETIHPSNVLDFEMRHGGWYNNFTMNVVEVIPLVRGSQLETLSYYSSQNLLPGQIITVPIRKQEKSALITRVVPGSTTKAALRAATFTLRKLPEQAVIGQISSGLLELAKSLEAEVPARAGAILHALLPKEVREGEQLISENGEVTREARSDVTVTIGTYEDRFVTYRSRIRETFAHRGSVLFVVPTSADVARAQATLEAGIEKRVVAFSPTLTAKKLAAAYQAFADVSHAKLIITTPSHAFLDRHDITEVIIDQSRSRAYKSRMRPYLDIRDAVKRHATITGRNVLLGDLLPRAEDEWRRREEFYLTDGEAPKRLTLPSKLEVISVPQEKTGKFELFLPPVVEELSTITQKRKNIFMYAARRGIAPVVACVDCGYVFRCPHSGAPYTLFKTGAGEAEKRWFVSAASGRRIQAADTCPVCNSWRLRERGIGIQHIEQQLRAEFPGVPLIVFDHTTATTPRKAASLMAKFYDTKGAILLGTAMALPYLEKPVPYSVITSLDAARAVPTWRAEEELFSLLLTLREKTEEVCYVQTRSEPDDILKLAAQGQLEQFCDDELELRQQLGYPPFATLVHLTFQGPASTVAAVEKEVAAALHSWQPRFYHSPTSTHRQATRYGLIRIPNHKWPEAKLIKTLRQLPPAVRIEINPDRVV
jgi:primosomal protein N'